MPPNTTERTIPCNVSEDKARNDIQRYLPSGFLIVANVHPKISKLTCEVKHLVALMTAGTVLHYIQTTLYLESHGRALQNTLSMSALYYYYQRLVCCQQGANKLLDVHPEF